MNNIINYKIPCNISAKWCCLGHSRYREAGKQAVENTIWAEAENTIWPPKQRIQAEANAENTSGPHDESPHVVRWYVQHLSPLVFSVWPHIVFSTLAHSVSYYKAG